MSGAIYQLKVTLKNTKPPIWRRVEVPGDFTLGDLHGVLQMVMDWQDEHLHVFTFGETNRKQNLGLAAAALITGGWGDEMGERSFSDPARGGGDDEDEWEVTLEEVAKKVKTKFAYEYDFGDGWDHVVVVEKIKDAEAGVFYPRCTGGRGRAPVEDCGGTWGWYELLAIVNNPRHPEYAERREWLGLKKKQAFDEEAFDMEGINKLLRKAFGKRAAPGEGAEKPEPGEPAQADVPGQLRLISYKVVFEPMEESEYELPGEIKEEVDSWYSRIPSDPKRAIEALEGLLQRYPTAARLMNYLWAAYSYAEKPEKAREIAERNYRENPGYLFAKLSFAEHFLNERNFEKVKEIMQDKWELSLHYPARQEFHVSEVLPFLAMAGRYLAGTGNLRAAETYLDMIEQLAPGSQAAKAVEEWIMMATVEEGIRALSSGKLARKGKRKRR